MAGRFGDDIIFGDVSDDIGPEAMLVRSSIVIGVTGSVA